MAEGIGGRDQRPQFPPPEPPTPFPLLCSLFRLRNTLSSLSKLDLGAALICSKRPKDARCLDE